MSSVESRLSLSLLRRMTVLLIRISGWRLGAVLLLNLVMGLVPAAQVSLTAFAVQSAANAVSIGGLESSMAQTALWSVALLVAVMALSFVLSTVDQYASTLMRLDLARQVDLMVMDKALGLDLQQFESAETYDHLQRASVEAGPRLFDMFSQSVSIMRDFVTLLTVALVLFTWNPWIAILVILSPLPSILANFRYGKRGYELEYGRAQLRRRLAYFRFLTTNDGPVKEVRLFGVSSVLADRYKSGLLSIFKQDRSLARYQLWAVGAWSLLGVLLSGLALGLGYMTSIASGQVGQLAAYLQAIGSVRTAATGFLMGISGLYQNALYVTNLFEFLDLPNGMIEGGARSAPLRVIEGIEFRNVSFTYPGTEREVLSNVSFLIPANKCTALVGKNGSGKTTIVKLLARLYDPSAGQILIDGVDISEYDLDDLRSKLGVVFQDYVKYELTVRENVGFGRVDKMDDIEGIVQSLAASGADSFVDPLPSGLETPLGRRFNDGVQLSVGQWQRLALSRAFMRKAAIVILDEPTASVDAVTEFEIFARFREIMNGATSVLIGHRFSNVRVADRIIVLDGGTVAEIGDHDELLRRRGIYHSLFSLQAEGYR